MSVPTRLAWSVMLPHDDDVIPGEGIAYDAQLEHQIAHMDSLSLHSLDDDAGEWDGDWETPLSASDRRDALLDPFDAAEAEALERASWLPRARRFS